MPKGIPKLETLVKRKISNLSKMPKEMLKPALNEDGTLNRTKYSQIPEVKETLQFFVDNGLSALKLMDMGYITAGIVFDFSVVEKKGEI